MAHLPRASIYPGGGAASSSTMRQSMAPGVAACGPGALQGGSGGPQGSSIAEQMSQIDQAITLTLQEIDENFARSHQIITGRILPAVKHYGESSYRISHATRFWRFFFETAAQVQLDINDSSSAYGESSASYDRSRLEQDDLSPLPHGKARGHNHQGEGGDESNASFPGDASLLANDSLYQSMRNTRVSSAPQQKQGSTGEEPRWADLESPYERALRLDIGHEMQTQGHVGRAARDAISHNQGQSAGYGALARDVAELRVDEKDGDDSSWDIATPPKITSAAAAGGVPNAVKASSGNLRNAVLRNAISGTPPVAIRGSARNPFAHSDAVNTPGKAPTLGDGARWNGIADLRKTPLNTNKAQQPDSSLNSFARALHHSPPVTMQFSIPRSKYLRTPAKEAARMVVDDLLRTAGGSRIAPPSSASVATRECDSPRTRFLQRQQASATRGGTGSSHEAPSAAGRRTAPGTGAAVVRSAVIGTPLKTNRRSARGSMPTPPTITRQEQGLPRIGERVGESRHATPASAAGAGGSSSKASSAMLMDEDEGGADPPQLGSYTGYAGRDDDDDDSDSDDDDSDSDSDDDGFAPPIAAPASLSGNRGGASAAPGNDPPSSVLSSSFSALAVQQSLKDDTLFGSKMGPNPFARAGSASLSGAGPTSGSGPGGAPVSGAGSKFQPLGNLEDMGTVYEGRPLFDQDKTNTWSAESPSKGGR
ncbi:hypothetical protein K437DRAFT_259031 [Tilletiaria anomala UBC 951]|uniref:DASH complex subunit ASK1 n=1 Tax=Tilletiaria anomala (strain ATCC 24038 / CBS 436.72 / UBC 951) TaxID=1037660 RepID=A0A066VLT0_TILAU|nr:uncharacterized protein K437DRAFT_259031 [Tilletiaria anomala UBC 951]KDN39540.1 hypothetical protein K437DRAFT_259031 [Tilletiaria anomala UBC 951]